MQRKSILGLHRTYYGMLRGGIKGEKGRDQGDLGRKKPGKMEGQMCLVTQMQAGVSTLLWPCLTPDHHSLSHLLIKLHFSFPG